MNSKQKLEEAARLEREANTIRINLDNERIRKIKPLEAKSQKLRRQVYKREKELFKDIEKDVKEFVKVMKKKYKHLKSLEIDNDNSFLRNKAEISVYFEIDFEDLIAYTESPKKPKPPKGRVLKENEKPKKLKTKGKK